LCGALTLFCDIERATGILKSLYKLPGEYIGTLNLIFSRFAEVAGPSADVVRDTVICS
jgi:hypothetical protein